MARAPNKKVDEAYELYKKGYKLVDIAKELDMAESTIRVWKNRYKWDDGNEVEVVKKNIYGSSSISCGCKAIKQKRNASKRAQEKLKKIDWKEGTSLSRIDRDKLLKNNTSGITGVTWNKTRKRWVAQIVFKNQYFMLGRFKNKEDAIAVRKEAEKKLFKPIIDKYKKI